MLIPNGEFSVVGCRAWNKRSNLQLFLWSLKRPKFWNNETYCLIRPVRSHTLHLFQGANLGKAFGSTGTPHNSKRKSAHGLNPNLALLGKRGDEDVRLNANAAAHRRRDKSVTERHLRKRKRDLRTFPFVPLTPGPPGRPDYRRLDLGRPDCHGQGWCREEKVIFPVSRCWACRSWGGVETQQPRLASFRSTPVSAARAGHLSRGKSRPGLRLADGITQVELRSPAIRSWPSAEAHGTPGAKRSIVRLAAEGSAARRLYQAWALSPALLLREDWWQRINSGADWTAAKSLRS